MRINKSLNLVLPVEIDGVDCWIHSTPISLDVFEKYFEPMSLALSTMYAQGNHIAAPKIAAMMLKKVAKRLGEWEGADGVQNGLINEIKRLTNLVIPGINGWETLPYYVAVQQNRLTADDISEIESIVIFFILASSVHGKKGLPLVMPLLERWGAQEEYLTSTEFAASLPILTKAETSTKVESI